MQIKEQTKAESIAEYGKFQRQNQRATIKTMQLAKQMIQPTLKRNDTCWCGSGVKYKKCHWKEDK